MDQASGTSRRITFGSIPRPILRDAARRFPNHGKRRRFLRELVRGMRQCRAKLAIKGQSVVHTCGYFRGHEGLHRAAGHDFAGRSA